MGEHALLMLSWFSWCRASSLLTRSHVLQEHLLSAECPGWALQQLWGHCASAEEANGEDSEGDGTAGLANVPSLDAAVSDRLAMHAQELDDANKMLARGR